MPPIRLNLQELPPAMSNAVADATHGCDMSGNSAQGTCSCDGIGRAGVATAFGMPFAEALGNWPLVALNTVHATIKGWFTRLDVMLLDLPYGVGPVVSTMVRLLSLMLVASAVSSIISKAASDLLKLRSKASHAVADSSSSYTPGRHNWVAAQSRWDPHYCSICSEAIAWVSAPGVRCQICGSHAHLGCSKRAHKEGLACKTLCSSDVELSHRRLFNPLDEDDRVDLDACTVSDEGEKKPAPIMRHQWMRGSIDDSQPCSACGGSCAGSGATGQHGFSCSWCKLQVHEACVTRVADAECRLGRHRRLILPPIAVIKDLPTRRGGLIREAVSKVRSVLPGHRDDDLEPPSCFDPENPTAGLPPGVPGQEKRFVDAMKGAAAAAASEVGLDVAGAKEGGRRFAEKVLDSLPRSAAEDGVWEDSLGMKECDEESSGIGADGSSREAGLDGVWDAALSSTSGSQEDGDDDREAATAAAFERGLMKGLVEDGRMRGDAGDSRGYVSSSSPPPPTPLPSSRSSERGTVTDAEGVGGDKSWRESTQGSRVPQQDIERAPAFQQDGTSSRRKKSELESLTSEFVVAEAGVLRPFEKNAGSSAPLEGRVVSGDGRGGSGVLTGSASEEQPFSDETLSEDPAFTSSEAVSGEKSGDGENSSDVPGEGQADDAFWGPEDRGQEQGVMPEKLEQEQEQEQKPEQEAEQEPEQEQEWVVKMLELKAKFQTSGEGAEATKSVSYSRKTRSVTLTICEENIPDDACPLLVFVNSKSGGKQGELLLSRFRALLNPLQVADLSQEDPLEVLTRFRNVPNLRLLACGGDGTVAWLLQSVDAITWKVKRPPLAVLPLGTGNDLARVLGWGPGYGGEGLENLLDTIENAQVTMLDRWSVSVVSTGKGGFRKNQKAKDRNLVMNNYLGIGVDGQVSLDFHKMREARPVLFFNRAVNKVLYAQLGARSALVRACHDLPARLELRCDGRLVELPETTASIIALNINSYAGGSKLWAVEERNRRAWAGRTSNHPESYPQTKKSTMWGFGTSGLVNPGGMVPAAGSGVMSSPNAARDAAEKRQKTVRLPCDGEERSGSFSSSSSSSSSSTTEQDISAVNIPPGGSWEGPAFPHSPLGGSPNGRGSSEDESSGSEVWEGEGKDRWLGWAGQSTSGMESGEGPWDRPRDSRGSSSVRRESKTSFHDGVLEVVAVEGVLHLGQIRLGLSRALAVAQCREMQVRTCSTLPMQVDGEPWKQPPSEITVKLHNQAAMLRPATLTERAVTSVLNDVSNAIHGAEEDLIINERQARTLLSRIRRSTRMPP